MSELKERDRLDDEQLHKALEQLSDWVLTPDRRKLKRTFVFADFQQAFAFMTRIALKAESINHHPEWSNVWNRVEIELTTHTAGGVTAKDLELAAYVDRAASQFDLLCTTDEDSACGGCR